MAIPGLRSWIPADTATAKSSICIATACPTNGLTSFEEWVIHSVDPSVGLDVQSLQNLFILDGFTRQNNLDQVLRWDLVQPQVFGQPVHAATELDFGIHLSRGVLGVDFVHCKKKGGVTFWPNLVKKIIINKIKAPFYLGKNTIKWLRSYTSVGGVPTPIRSHFHNLYRNFYILF